MSNKPNELINESSPYLLQHAYNPVQWHAWNAKNIEKAKSIGKPLLISIGYSSCHWCHVMEHESFEDQKVAELMNEFFFCIKVDKEERPDVDQLYMTAANIITGSGGWPLNCFALPDGKPFHAGTYYPKKQWIDLLQKVYQQFKENHERIVEYAQKLTQGIRLQETVLADSKALDLDLDYAQQGIDKWKNKWDMAWGGSIGAPKFPMPNQLEFLLGYNEVQKDDQTSDYIELSLQKMMFGGIYDQIRGGFARYSVDGVWKVPHFEKMLYDNAQLLSVYAKGSTLLENKNLQKVCEQTVEWLKEDMLDPSGLYYSAIDADSEGVEGKYYIWNKDEIHSLLAEDIGFVEAYYSLQDIHMWEKGQYVLMRRRTDNQLMEEFDLDYDQLQAKVESINATLLAHRRKRVKPGVDTKCLTSWNGMLLRAYCDLYSATLNLDYLDDAKVLANALIKNQFQDNNLLHSFKDGRSSIDGMLEDAAFLGMGLLELFKISSEEIYFKKAVALADLALDSFYDSNKKIFYMHKENEMILQVTEVYDNVIPSSNSAITLFLYELGLLKGDGKYLNVSKELVSKIQHNLAEHLESHTNWAIAHQKMSSGIFEIIIVGPNAREFYEEIKPKTLLNNIILYTNKESDLPMFRYRYKPDKTLIYICKEGQCSAPLDSVHDTLDWLELNQKNN